MFSGKSFSNSPLILLLIVLVLGCSVFGCSDDDDDDDDTGNLPPIDDDDSDDDDNDDDDSAATPQSVEIVQSPEIIPADTTATFTALVTYSDDSTQINPDGLTWSTGDGGTATVDQGVVTGIADGATTLTATISDVKAADTIDIFVGPDLYVYDFFTNTFDAIDRGQKSYLADYTGAGAAVGIMLNDIFFADQKLYLADSGDFDIGSQGDEGVVVVDPVAMTSTKIPIAVLAPWATLYDKGTIYLTGNLDDQLGIYTDGKGVEYVALPADCVPAELAKANDKIYISCTGFDIGPPASYGNTIAVYDPSTKGVSTITLETGENPGKLIPTEDETAVYVIATGDYATVFGAVNRIDTATDTVASSLSLGGSLGLADIGLNGYLFVLDGADMYVIDTSDDNILRGEANPVEVGNDGDYLAGLHVHNDTGHVYVSGVNFTTFTNSVFVIDGAAFNNLHTYDVSDPLAAPGRLASW